MIVFLPDAPTPIPARPPSHVATSPANSRPQMPLVIAAYWTRRPVRDEWIIGPPADEDNESEHD
jgi:hypothetical protein